MLGNNLRSAKIKRVLVPLTNGSAQGRFQLPEDPELERKNIVGVSVSFAAGTYGDISAITPYTEGNLLVRIPRDTDPQAKRFFLTLYNQQNEIIVENFPLYALYNRTAADVARIIPINGKIKARQSFLQCSGRLVPAVFGTVPTIYLNFFYL